MRLWRFLLETRTQQHRTEKRRAFTEDRETFKRLGTEDAELQKAQEVTAPEK